MRLFEIEGNMIALRALIEAHVENTDGEITPDVEAHLTAWMLENEGNLADKVDGYCAIISEQDYLADLHKAERDRHAKRMVTAAKTSQFLKDRLLPMLERHGLTKIKGRFNLTICANGGFAPLSLLVPEEDVPAEYTKTETKTRPDMVRIRQELEVGMVLPFARLEERGRHLKIR